MFAGRAGSKTYHLVDTRTGLTACGLKTVAMRVRRNIGGAPLRQTPTRRWIVRCANIVFV